jgi:DNA-directed RNA polymerase sigma subunit (sigma70/sigma32)
MAKNKTCNACNNLSEDIKQQILDLNSKSFTPNRIASALNVRVEEVKEYIALNNQPIIVLDEIVPTDN